MNARGWKTLLLTASLAISGASLAQENGPSEENNGSFSRPESPQLTGRIILKWRSESMRAATATVRAQKASTISGLKLRSTAQLGDRTEVLESDVRPTPTALEDAIAQLERNPDVEYASPEYRRKAHAETNDPLLIQQWYLLSDQPSATRADAAWDVTHGSEAIVVAVLDTGVRFDHPDLSPVSEPGGKLLPGYDFISNSVVANDGDGRDSDASDPGDWVSLLDVQQNGSIFNRDCLNDDGRPVNSSWHGTRVAGLIAARTNNMIGVAGNAWNTLILPVRVLGKCGGLDGDIISGMRWAAGLSVPGVPDNPTPAHVINLSLGGESACSTAYQSAINEIIARGVLVVASAGNDGTRVSSPANCSGVLGVAGLRHAGTKVGFSSLGPQIGIGAPGGNCVNASGECLFPITVATNTGLTVPASNGYSDSFKFNVGTSFSAPMAASAAALLKSVNETLTPAQIVFLLKDSAKPFPVYPSLPNCQVPTATSAPQLSECNCTTRTCGAGMLDTGAAVLAALAPLAVLELSGNVEVGATIIVDGRNSFGARGRTIAAHHWSVLNVNGATPTIANMSDASTILQIPGLSQFTLRLTVTDDQGAQGTKEIALATATPAPPVPAPSGISTPRGGGGSFGWTALLLGLFATAGRVRRTKRDGDATMYESRRACPPIR